MSKRFLPCLLLPPAWSVAACGPWYLEQVGAVGEPTVVEIEPPDELAFGAVSPAASPARLEATVSAAGDGQIALESLVIEPDGDGAFTLGPDPSPCVISSGEEVVVEVAFHPDATGTYIGRISFHARVSEDSVVLNRRLSGTGCNDPDQDGTCGAPLPGWEPFGPPDDTAMR